MIEESFPMNGVARQTGIDTTPTAVPDVLIHKGFFRLIRATLAKNILKNHRQKNTGAGIAATLKAACRYAMEKGNRFARGPAYKGHGKKVLSSVGQTARWYEGMGYTKLMEFDDPPVYAVLKRGHHEVHIFQPPDPTLRAWLENDEAALDDPAIRAYLLQKSGLDEWELPVASKPHYFHINEVDDVFIATADEAQ